MFCQLIAFSVQFYESGRVEPEKQEFYDFSEVPGSVFVVIRRCFLVALGSISITFGAMETGLKFIGFLWLPWATLRSCRSWEPASLLEGN